MGGKTSHSLVNKGLKLLMSAVLELLRGVLKKKSIIVLRLKQNGCHIEDYIFKWIVLNKKWIVIIFIEKISLCSNWQCLSIG